MASDRIEYAIAQGGLVLPQGRIAFVGAQAVDGLPEGLDQAYVIQGFRPEVEAWEAQGVTVRQAFEAEYAAAVVTLPRTRERAEDWIARAEAAAPGGLIVIDGAKTDGIEAIAKALKGRVTLDGQVSKAHGKCLWFRAQGAFGDWIRPDMARNAGGDMVAPGVFSADGPDPASVALAAVLPASLKGEVADLGAGWGWLSREILKHGGVTRLHLVEADKAALDCARVNVADPRAEFHWADATHWTPERALNAVVMNPPFHTGRKAEPQLGQAFIAAAARVLAPSGLLFMVANRHLPYETTLATQFREVAEIAGDARFKIVMASRPTRHRR